MGLPGKASKPPGARAVARKSQENAALSANHRPSRRRQRLAFAAKARYSDCMKRKAPALGLGVCVLAVAMLAWGPVAEAQFFWSPFFQQEQPKRQKVRPAKPKAPADDLPPIIPRESSAPPPPDDRPYDAKLLRLAEILGAVHYLRELCGAQEGQLWRDQMKEIVKNEGSTAVRRAKLVNSFNDGYRGYRRTYRTCTSSATVAITRFSVEGAQIAVALAKPSHYASRGSTDVTSGSTTTATDAAPAPATGNTPAAADGATPTPETKPADATKPATNQTEATPQTQANQGQAATPEAGQVDGAEKPKRKKRKAAKAKPAETEQSVPLFGRQ
jgi:uncharacterized protein (TIGR02301 family)